MKDPKYTLGQNEPSRNTKQLAMNFLLLTMATTVWYVSIIFEEWVEKENFITDFLKNSAFKLFPYQ